MSELQRVGMSLASESEVAVRQPKTDRLILGRLLKAAAMDMRYEDRMRDAHSIVVRWADLESSGKLSQLNETQMQGDFLTQIFGEVLGYPGPLENKEAWHRAQHHAIDGGTPDAVLGNFSVNGKADLLAVIELKGPTVHLDRHRSNGRTAVDQCWDYLVNTPCTCRWGIVSNMVSFRLYERNSTKRAYEHFSLQALRDFSAFRQFYTLFHRDGLIGSSLHATPLTAVLLKDSGQQQRSVGEELYETYSEARTDLIAHLHLREKHPLEEAMEMAQRLLDRIIFIAFCEDRNLMPHAHMIEEAMKVAGFQSATNPRWQSFKNLFHFINEGNERNGIQKYNGGLFAKHPVDDLELPDEPFTTFFASIGKFDFRDEVNLDVLGHIFEKSITELQKIKESGFFGGKAEEAEKYAKMPQSVKRKQLGIYYTPPDLTGAIVQYTVTELIDERFHAAATDFGVTAQDAKRGKTPDDVRFWYKCLAILQDFRIVDPACGSGAFLFQAYDVLEQRYGEIIGHLEEAGKKDAKKLFKQIPEFILNQNIYGVDLSPEAVEITQLALWIRSATPGQTLAKLSKNIVYGNSLVHDTKVHAAGFDWQKRFPEVFDRKESGFDCVIGNPPWERMDLSEREFFSLSAPEIATATTGAKRDALIGTLEQEQPALYRQYKLAQTSINMQREYCQESGQYPLTGKGRTNLYAVFAELALQLVAPHGRAGILVPSGIASDKTTMDFFAKISESNRLIRLYDFENRTKELFPEVDGRFKFCILNFGGAETKVDAADFVFYAHHIEDLKNASRHIALSGEDIRLLNPNTRTCPIFRSRHDAEITKDIYRRIPVLLDKNRKGTSGNLWGIRFKQGLFNQTTDSHLFHEADALKAKGFSLEGNRWRKGKQVYLPVYEAKMLQAYDHRAASVVVDESNWFRQGQTNETTVTTHQNPEFLAIPRWWIEASNISDQPSAPAYLSFKNVTSPTNRRTMIATMIPRTGVGNSAPLMITDSSISARSSLALLANLNSFVLDYIARNKVGNVNLNFFIIEQLPIFSPDVYRKPSPWDRGMTLEDWIAERVLKLTCTAEDMLPLAEACSFTSGSFQKEYGCKLHKWDDAERAELKADLDAAFFHLYGIPEDDVAHILSTFKGIHEVQEGLFHEHCSTAERILQKYREMANASKI